MATQNSFLTEELREKAIGTRGQPQSMEIEKGHIKRFAEAIGDCNPLFCDEVAARKSRYGGIIAPPTFVRSIRAALPPLPFDTPFDSSLDGGSVWEYAEPVRAGDMITAVAHIHDLYERQGRMGTMLFTVNQTTYSNQFGEVVATQRSTGIRYKS